MDKPTFQTVPSSRATLASCGTIDADRSRLIDLVEQIHAHQDQAQLGPRVTYFAGSRERMAL